MDWRIVLAIVLSVVMLGGFLWLGIAYGLARKREEKLRGEITQLRGNWREAVDEITRMVREKKNRKLSDEDAVDKLRAGIAEYSAHDPGDSGAGVE